jgi:mevalonate kinase
MTVATAPGKVILLGEHAVVYGRPAIAVPVWQAVATAEVADRADDAGCLIVARDLGQQFRLAATGDDQPLALVTRLALAQAGVSPDPAWTITLHSTIPIASGLGSGAALSTALVRALFAHAGQPAAPETVSAIVYASERIYHGTPSGIDNTVIAYGAPLWFVKDQPPASFRPPAPFTLVIAHTGVASPTRETVGAVRAAWQADTRRHEARFDAIAALVTAGRGAIQRGDWPLLGMLMDENQALLEELDVSSPELDRLVAQARAAGALGAKLSGGGRGGNIIALVNENAAEPVAQALRSSGAASVLVTTVQ